MRVFDVAIVDVLLTVLLAWIISVAFRGSRWAISFPYVLAGAFAAGIFAHALFGVQTTVNKFLGMYRGTAFPL